MKKSSRLILLFSFLFLIFNIAFTQTITVEEVLKDNENNNVVGFLNVSNPAFIYPFGATKTITGCTNATPIEVTTSASHGLSTNNSVYITGVTGNTACNGTWVITVTAATTFTLNGSAGNGVYGSGGTVQQIIPVAARTRRHPTSGTFSGTVTLNVIPTSTAIAIPGGSAAGFTYLVSYFLSDGSTYTEQWNPAPTPSKQTISGIRTPGVVNPTATISLTQLAASSATSTNILTFDGTNWIPYTVPPRALFTSTASATVANTVTETTIIGTGVGSLTLPANFYSGAGKALYIYSAGYYSNTGTPTLQFRLKHGATILATTGAVTTTTGASNWEWSFRALVICRTIGASGTVQVQGELFINTSTTAVNRYAMVNTTTSTIDTTVTQALDLMVTWGTASVSNTITGSNFTTYNIAIP